MIPEIAVGMCLFVPPFGWSNPSSDVPPVYKVTQADALGIRLEHVYTNGEAGIPWNDFEIMRVRIVECTKPHYSASDELTDQPMLIWRKYHPEYKEPKLK